ncbi:HAMP domain-containing sensor histidine kinase (plasmid) [Bacillus mycoides]|uniref:histidine kinase n=1 Tax=Bacillus mycoides TaxID=1405 RepID=A0A1S9T041_BACMY|nr:MULTISPECIES: HAMP domain-containing sensor histidine kinase [Bacillus]ARJ25328.1 two-component sensor histidine kinase [Bacillus mycoides]MBJ7960305.1 HAMP domain-containing histidine kinase [Bacillus cereus group sp. N28]MBJ7987414.1 HAMP domain-containing histidine kinase [Bacillus cereus]MDI6534358.1 HAMP domain-containing sensor histidine kinase [Bacillus mycoides]OOR03262.1 two-component sensor histidine kinase [Bacillus mycoides]
MRLRIQLLLMNLLSTSILVIAIWYSETQMLLEPEQTRLLTVIAVVGLIISTFIYWLMTRPIMRSIQNLIELTKQFSDRQFETRYIIGKEPREFKELATAFQQMAKNLEEGFTKLEEGEKARKELITNISHDLRTPMASIQLMIEALQDNLIEDPEMRNQYLVTILKEIKRLSGLINDLFDLSKLEIGQVDFHPTLIHMDKVLLDVLEAHSVLLANKQIDLQLEVPETLPRLLIMPCKIARVISNLLDNAIRYSPVSGTIQLILEENKQKQQVQFILRDEGEGITPNDQLRVFERFFRTDQSRSSQSGGSGLGLAITKSLIEMHSGEIGVRDRLDGKQGSEFWFTLPITSEKNKTAERLL